MPNFDKLHKIFSVRKDSFEYRFGLTKLCCIGLKAPTVIHETACLNGFSSSWNSSYIQNWLQNRSLSIIESHFHLFYKDYRSNPHE